MDNQKDISLQVFCSNRKIFDPNKKYPMIVYFHEKLSENLNRYKNSGPNNVSFEYFLFVSNGIWFSQPIFPIMRMVIREDSAVEYINSGAEYRKKNPWVDGKHIGIHRAKLGWLSGKSPLLRKTDMHSRGLVLLLLIWLLPMEGFCGDLVWNRSNMVEWKS